LASNEARAEALKVRFENSPALRRWLKDEAAKLELEIIRLNNQASGWLLSRMRRFSEEEDPLYAGPATGAPEEAFYAPEWALEIEAETETETENAWREQMDALLAGWDSSERLPTVNQLKPLQELHHEWRTMTASLNYGRLNKGLYAIASTGASSLGPWTPPPSFAAWAEKFGGQLITGILNRQFRKVAKVVAEGLAAGKPREAVMTDLLNRFPDMDILPEWRARLIAQTEAVRAYNGAMVERASDGDFSYLQWLDGQPAACPACVSLHLKTVKIGSLFQDEVRGLEVAYPPLHPGCRCSSRPVMLEDVSEGAA
jgi:SPP1 gp7 family putative phage head morphogenesis protein